MTRIRVSHDIGDLSNDLLNIATTARPKLAAAVRDNAREGSRIASRFARESAGRHGKHYHRSISAESRTPLSWEYGPDSSMPQGGMSFEFGSRNQKPHLDLARSADIVVPQLVSDVGDVLDDLFWPR